MEGKGSAVQAVDLLETLNHRRSAAAKEQRSCSISVTQDREQPPSLVKPVPSSVLADQEEEEEEEEAEEVGGSVVVMGVAAMATSTVKRPASTEISRDKKLAAAEEREKNIARLRRSSCGGYESMQQLQESKDLLHVQRQQQQLPPITSPSPTSWVDHSTTSINPMRSSSMISPLGWLNQMSLQHDLQQQKKKAVEQQLLLSGSNSQAPRNSMMVQQQDDAASKTSSHTAKDRHLREEAAEGVDDHDAPDHETSEDHTPLQQLSVLIPHNIIHEEQLPPQLAAANDQPASSSCTTAAAAAGFGSPLPLLQLQHFGPTTSLNAAAATTTTASGHLESLIKADAAAMESTQDKFKPVAAAAAPHQVGGGAGVVQVLPPTAQLTIFYAGIVHAYDDVPLDKLQAIMLLAGSRNTKSSSYTNLPGSCGASATATTAHPFLAPIIIPQATRTPSSSVPSTAHTTAINTAPTTTARPSSSASPGILTRPIARNVHAVTELPQARKASLARFLEKRKDRVRMKAPYPLTFAIKKEGPSTPRCDKSPSPPQRQPQTRSPSPAALMAGSSHQSAVMPSSTNSRDLLQYYKSSDTSSEPNSPTRSPPTPPRLSMAAGYVVNTTAGSCSTAAGVKDFERREQLVNSIPQYQNEKSSPLQKSSQDEKGEDTSMEDEDGTS
ncbi:hypothetical protein CY35_08G059000 [Sphagnum magellanicum]|nr:hypothetical protein CY35_08G059000 [Sphagnum magellanicum]